eukprot:TRINITY_DN46596_c0_g1_i1.p1 TRINITY_DN46596_c0_g1~~TRINITY_DN46596_c0_g1_i1.p1  ORF type:complete len:1212 (-),score=216.11 TRINITY_DN46596_c0_g1_i1:42-3587(-)
MAASGGAGGAAPKKQKIQLAMEEAELRSLRIPSSAHRGALSPSKNSFLPTLQEHAQERMQQMNKRERARRFIGAGSEIAESASGRRTGPAAPNERNVLSEISAGLLDSIKEDFMHCSGSLDLEQFTRSMLRNLAVSQMEGLGVAGIETQPVVPELVAARSVSFGGNSATDFDAALDRQDHDSDARDALRLRTSAVKELFEKIDVHSEGAITWDEVSNYLIEQGMAGRAEFTVDNIKTYEPSSCLDGTKHENIIEKLVYLEQIDAVVCMCKESRKFRLYNPKRCTVRNEVSGHRGTVINCCYVEPFGQIATTSADMTICLWDSTHLGLRNRLSTKDVQLCLQWDNQSNGLFSGSIDGTLYRWDLQEMCLSDTRRGQHKKPINDLLMVQDINLLASASSDGNILMWDVATMRPKKTFRGHKKSTYSLAYSMDYHCLLTAGSDQEALVWNPYVERVPIFRLKGHTHALCGVTVVPGTPQIVSADVTGLFRLWDMRNFRCVQSFGSNDGSSDLNSFCAIPPLKRLAAGGSRMFLYDYMDEWGGDSVTDSGGVTDALYNPNAACFYTVSKKSVKAWDAGNGHLFKVLRDIAKHEVTAACIADNGRKIYLGDSEGRVVAHDLENGTLLTEFEPHVSDISCLAIWKGTNRLFSAAWDGTVKMHSDERSRPPQMKAEFQRHRDGVTCLTCCPELRLLASGGTDMQVVLYDIRTLKPEHQFSRFHHVIAGMDFLPSRCLLAVADQGGLVSFWLVRPHPDKWTCVYHFRNLPVIGRQLPAGAGAHLSQPIPVSGICFAAGTSSAGPSSSYMFSADAKGTLRCWDLHNLFQKKNLAVENLDDLFEKQRTRQLAAQAAGGGHRGTAATFEVVQHSGTRQQNNPRFTTPSPAFGGGVGNAGAFLTGLEEDSAAMMGGNIRGSMDSAVVAAAGSTALMEEASEITLVREMDGHTDGVLNVCTIAGSDCGGAIMTCGLDKRVRIWSTKLDPYGVLLQGGDRTYKFPHDQVAKRQREMDEADALLDRLGHLEAKGRLPALMNSRRTDNSLLDFGTHGRRRQARRKDADAVWKVTAERIIADPDADEEDYRILFEQMERGGNTIAVPETAADETAQDRLVRNAKFRHATTMKHRGATLSRDEASAAERLARAMEALGGDDFGTYSAMAKSLDARSPAPEPTSSRSRRRERGGYPRGQL